jgi:hypothetical protein
VQLKIDEDGWNNLSEVIENYYKQRDRLVRIFSTSEPSCGSLDFCFLIDRKHVAKYIVGSDRRMELGVLLLAIGPHYFAPVDFWDYPNSQRFRIEASTEAVEHNLKLLDEFLGY